MVKYYKQLTKAVSTGTTETVEFAPEQDVRFGKVGIWSQESDTLRKTEVEIKIQDVPVTRPTITAQFLIGSYEKWLPINKDVGKGVAISFKITNNEGATRNYSIVLEILEA